jgi:rod shape-determining protein MreC
LGHGSGTSQAHLGSAQLKGYRTFVLRVLLVWVLLELIAAAQVVRNEEILLWSWIKAMGHPISASASWLEDLVTDASWGLKDSERLVGELQEMEHELEAAQARSQLLREEVAALREAQRHPLAFPQLVESCVIARCTYRDLPRGRFEVSAGKRDGVRADTPALSATGIVGRVFRVGYDRCWIEVLTSPAAAVAVHDETTGVEGLATGTGGYQLKVEFVPRRASLVRGTPLVTSGADGIYPPGILVGHVSSVRETEAPFLEVRAEPSADLARLRVVTLVPGWAAGSVRDAR